MATKHTIRKVYRVSAADQLLITLPKDKFNNGDLVVVRKATAEDLNVFTKIYWQCDTCKNTGCSEQMPTICPYCNSKRIIEIGGANVSISGGPE